MRVEIARVSPSRQILSTWGTKAAVERQPAIMPTIVGSQLCMLFSGDRMVRKFGDRQQSRWARKRTAQGQSRAREFVVYWNNRFTEVGHLAETPRRVPRHQCQTLPR